MSRAAGQLGAPWLLLAITLIYLEFGLLASVLAAATWVLQGAFGAVCLEYLLGRPLAHHRMFVMLGPGALFGIGLSVSLYLIAQGGAFGVTLVTLSVGAGAIVWLFRAEVVSEISGRLGVDNLVALIGCTLLANSREFPNLLLPGLVVLASLLVVVGSRHNVLRVTACLSCGIVLAVGVVRRPLYWWWVSDDTMTLSAIGTMIVKRGRIAEIAGYQTEAYHWLLHVWLALWSDIAKGEIFRTYLIAWPLVAVVSTIASLLLFIELSSGRTIDTTFFVAIAVVVSGLLRFEWAGPHAQEPFLFAMAACAALWLTTRRIKTSGLYLRRAIAALVLVLVVPSWLYVLKPSLLVAYGLLVVGAVLQHFDLFRGKRLFVAVMLSAAAITAGIALMSLGGSLVSRRSLFSFSVDFFPDDLGWCKSGSGLGSLACVFSIQVVLFSAAFFAGVMLWSAYRHDATRSGLVGVSPLILLPITMAYLPLRYFISTSVGSGAPSFYRLSEMALVLVVALGFATLAVSYQHQSFRWLVLLSGSVLAALLSRTPSRAYDIVGSWLVALRFTHYLNASDVIALAVVLVIAPFLARIRQFAVWRPTLAAVALCLVGLTPFMRTALASATEAVPIERLDRPRDLGPEDLDEVAAWLRDNTPRDIIVATNYLCPSDRLEECTHSTAQRECPLREPPALVAGWVFVAISQRDFLYLSQYWDTRTSRYFDHQLSARLGSTISAEAVRALQARDVMLYVASREHSSPEAWKQLRAFSDYSTDHFVVVSLQSLLQQITN
jgi:hypothetical protein